jgi:hypothetical protein
VATVTTQLWTSKTTATAAKYEESMVRAIHIRNLESR